MICQERHGERRTDPSTGSSSTVWYRTVDKKWFPALYWDLPVPAPDVRDC
ncbi:hypothetical protein [Rhizocola hellebori]|nr:hypothetical protein [Rhizocola hellebori]